MEEIDDLKKKIEEMEKEIFELKEKVFDLEYDVEELKESQDKETTNETNKNIYDSGGNQ